jgi:hypothetical protein
MMLPSAKAVATVASRVAVARIAEKMNVRARWNCTGVLLFRPGPRLEDAFPW